MSKKSLSSLTDQVTDLLRQGMVEGRWRDTLPGRNRLANELGCCHATVETAMRTLSREGILVSQGPGRRRKIVLSGKVKRISAFRVSVLCYEKSDLQGDPLLSNLVSQLKEAGYDAILASKTLHDLGMDVERVAQYVEKADTDAWVVMAGSREVIEWFGEQSVPTFALFGRASRSKLACAGATKGEAYQKLVDKLYDLGHRRMVMLVREERRKPTQGQAEQAFLKQLEKKGLQTSEYNIPDWGDNPEDLYRIMDSLFQYTPPTAIILDDLALFMAVLQHLGRLGMAVPEQVSLACMDDSPFFSWCVPTITHITSDPDSLVRRVVKWVGNVSQGKEDRRKTPIKAQLVIGGTLGPAPK